MIGRRVHISEAVDKDTFLKTTCEIAEYGAKNYNNARKFHTNIAKLLLEKEH